MRYMLSWLEWLDGAVMAGMRHLGAAVLGLWLTFALWLCLVWLVSQADGCPKAPGVTPDGESATGYWRPVGPPPGVQHVRCWAWSGSRLHPDEGGPQCFVVATVREVISPVAAPPVADPE